MDANEIFKQHIGSFAVVDYSTPQGIETARGEIVSVSDKGDVIIVHTQNDKISWGFNTSKAESWKFSPIKTGGSK